MPYRAALLDLDDTTLNREETVSRLIDRFIEHFASALDPGFLPKLKPLFVEIDDRGDRPREELFHNIIDRFAWTSKPDTETIKKYWNEELPRCAQPMPGLYETLAFLRESEMKIAVVTNGTSKMQNAKIDALHMRGLVDAVVISGEAGLRKPDRRIFELAQSKVDAHTGEAFFVGDDPEADIQGAKAAGLTAIWMSHGRAWSAGKPEPDHVIGSLLDLKRMI